MTGDAKQAVKDEPEDDLDGPISGLSRKPLKKEELIPKDERDDDNTPLALSKAQKKRPSISPKVEKQEPVDDEDEKPLKKKKVLKKMSKPKSVKKELDSEEEEEDGKLSMKSRKRKRVEKKKTTVKVKKESVSQEKIKSNKKEKKQYQLPGQKHEPPEMRDPLRIFYESLYEKVPTSEMAAAWLMERGLLSPEEAEKVYAKKLRKHHIQKFGSPGKVTPVKKSSTTSVKKKVKVTSKTTAKKTIKKKLGNSEAGEDDCGHEKTTPAKKSSAVSVKKQVKVTSKTTAKKSKKNLSDSEADEDDDFVLTKKKSGNRKASA